MKYVIIVDPLGETAFEAGEYDTQEEALRHLPKFAEQYGEGHCHIRRCR